LSGASSAHALERLPRVGQRRVAVERKTVLGPRRVAVAAVRRVEAARVATLRRAAPAAFLVRPAAPLVVFVARRRVDVARVPAPFAI